MNFLETRRNMVNSQLLPNKVTDLNVLKAFMDLPRELFVPSDKKNIAYILIFSTGTIHLDHLRCTSCDASVIDMIMRGEDLGFLISLVIELDLDNVK